MPADQRQINRERIDALTELLEESGIGPTEHIAALRDAEEIGDASEVAAANRQGGKP